ncbi:MAG: NDP-hexose 3,4-dehydratase [Candidatus Magasanikbacteria bacterium GW2011_GWA2_45_39]|uniref:NDP-hexose 3,4-dehydratase n=1 Tax=Candidatus Magasanikbacteria bacterium GW2011_GWA2_45_39 TaxID=1619041 RepID=A0A0G1MHR4_9BACT|nr:MAG: NDP-hexose 3,4-dehydratase [Candidatus Magasanikbacteria bacterium GW2011_GWA2_45_39]
MSKRQAKTSSALRVPYALAVFGNEERQAVAEVLKTPMIVPGARVKKFEGIIAKLFAKKYGVMVNSGSSANLIAFEIMNLPRGSEVITPVLTFGTTLAPILQKGLVPVFADVIVGDYTINIDQIEKLITKKTRALMIPSLIGNIPDFCRLRKIADKHKIWLIEDSCDTLGPKLYGKSTGSFTDISTTSFYASHIITAAGSGGMICLNSPELYKHAKTLAGWGRASAINESEEASQRFKGRIDGIPYDGKFIFIDAGYNFQSTEIAAAFALEQLKKFKNFFAIRQRNFNKLLVFFKQFENLFILPKTHPAAETVWLAFPLVLRDKAPFARAELVKYLEEHNIQTRPIFTGNVLRQPAFKGIKCRRLKGGYPASDLVMRGSLLIGCHHGLEDKHIEYLKEVFTDFLKKY